MIADTEAVSLIGAMVGGAYLVLTALIVLQAKRSRTGILLALACAATAFWAIGSAIGGGSTVFQGFGGGFDLIRAAVWYFLILHLYRQAVARRGVSGIVFVAAGIFIVAGSASVMAFGMDAKAGSPGSSGPLWSGMIGLRLFTSIGALLLLENLCRNSSDELRGRLQLAAVALGGLAAYDVAVCADAALFHRVSEQLATGRFVVALIVVPLLAFAAARNRRWAIGIHVSRTAVFYSATLIVSGVFLLALAAAVELAKQMGPAFSPQWGSVVQIGLGFSGLLAVALLLISQNSRSWLRSVLVDHFFTHRYDYRHEWLRCIETLSDRRHGDSDTGSPSVTLETRAVRAVAQLVDSPAGMLLLRERAAEPLRWAGSWQVASSAVELPPHHVLTQRLTLSDTAVVLTEDLSPGACLCDDSGACRAAWLAVPLREDGVLAGCILVAPPRAPFPLDGEVFDLLRTVASEVATYLAEQRAERAVQESREMRAYGERFAFVAHDIKNVSSQLAMLLSNAEIHLANPAFQRDMLATVQASVTKIGTLLRRLQSSEPVAGDLQDRLAPLTPLSRLQSLAEELRQTRRGHVAVEHDGGNPVIGMDAAAFDAVATHLLNNAIEASDEPRPVFIRLRQQADSVIIDIMDQGRGMTQEFVRDRLFQPFQTSKREGSGIGAFQARELLRTAGGSLSVISRPGAGTTMRVCLPLIAAPSCVAA